MHTVFVDGQEGTTGLQISDRLSRHGKVRLLEIDPDRRKDSASRAALINEADAVFLCLPDAAARDAVALCETGNRRTRFIDASTAHRTADGWVYGLPELARGQREKIRASRRVAVTGCHAAGFVLAVAPLVAIGLLPADYPLTCHSITGYSGGGKKMIAAYEAARDSRALDAARPYALEMAHKHLPEMRVHTGLAFAPAFVPIVDNFYRGMAVSVPLQPRAMKRGTTRAMIHAALSAHYEGEAFVRVMALDGPDDLVAGQLDVQACNDTNRNDIFVFGNDEHVLLVSRLDNLGKGASGAAVQCMNLMLGFDERTGLSA